MKNKFRTYGFWTALAGAVVVLLNALGQAFGFAINNEIVTNIIMAIAGVLVVFGVVSMPKKENEDNNEVDFDENIDEVDAEINEQNFEKDDDNKEDFKK